MIPASLVLLGVLVVVVDAIAVAVFITRWERRAAAPRQLREEMGPRGVGAADHSRAPHRSASVQAETRADALSN